MKISYLRESYKSSVNLLMRSEKSLKRFAPFFRLCVAFCNNVFYMASDFLNLVRKIYYGVVCEILQKPKLGLNHKVNDSIANLGESKTLITPPPALPLKKGRGEVFISFGLPPTYFLKKSKQKIFDLGNLYDSARMFCGDFKQGGIAPLNPQNCVDSEFKNFCLLLQSKSKWGLGQSPTLSIISPLPFVRGGAGGGVKNPKNSRESQIFCKLFLKFVGVGAKHRTLKLPSLKGNGLWGGFPYD